MLALLAAALVACGSGHVSPGGDGGSGAGPDASPQDLPLGLHGAYFHKHGSLAAERDDPVVQFDWGADEPAAGVGADHFSVRWTGYLEVPQGGAYSFATVADDGVRLWVDNQPVLDDWTMHPATRVEGTLELAAGFVPIRLEYFEGAVTAGITLTWRPPGASADQVIPQADLRALASAAESPKPPYINPVVPADCPDPGVVALEAGGYAMVCTGGRLPVHRSDDLVLWEDSDAAILPDGKPSWAANGFRNWAPEIHRVGAGYVAYFTSVNGADVLSVGAASASDPFGAWSDRGGPLVEAAVGVIDASHFTDRDGRQYLLYKIDGNSQGQPTPIYLRELTADGDRKSVV